MKEGYIHKIHTRNALISAKVEVCSYMICALLCLNGETANG